MRKFTQKHVWKQEYLLHLKKYCITLFQGCGLNISPTAIYLMYFKLCRRHLVAQKTDVKNSVELKPRSLRQIKKIVPLSCQRRHLNRIVCRLWFLLSIMKIKTCGIYVLVQINPNHFQVYQSTVYINVTICKVTKSLHVSVWSLVK